MTLALIALAVLAVVIFGFVLEPIVRARGDQAVLDAAALPEHELMLDDADGEPDGHDRAIDTPDQQIGGRLVGIERPAGSDAS